MKDHVKEGSNIAISVGDYFSTMLDQTLSWNHAEDLKSKWNGKFCLKGIMSPRDARKASTYASRFRDYRNQRFKIVESRSLPKNRHAVKTQLFSGEAVVSLEYHLQKKESVWQIYDIVANGVSDLSLKRAAYGKTLSEIGFPGLVEDINEEIKKNRQKSL